MIILHHGWRSSDSRRVRLSLAEKGLAYESRLVDMVIVEQHSPEYLAMNPNGVVPTLIHDGRVLYESSVIAEYLDEVFPDPPLLPADPYDRAVMRNFVRWIDENSLPKLIVFNWSQSMQPVASEWTEAELAERLSRVPSASRREAWTRVARSPYTEAEKNEAMAGLVLLLDKMEDMLKQAEPHEWLLGERFCLADIAAIPFVKRISELNAPAVAQHERVARWWERVQQRESFKQARIEAYSDSLKTETSTTS